MTEVEKLILHLQNLSNSNTKKVTLDVQFLLEILNALPKSDTNTAKKQVAELFNVDGGSFHDKRSQ